MSQTNNPKPEEVESEEEKLRLLSTEKFGFILSLKSNFAFVQSYFEDQQFFLHVNEFYPDIAVNDTVAFHFTDAPKGKQVTRIRKLDVSASSKILDNVKGTVVRSNDNRVKYNNVGLLKLDKSSLDHAKEYQQFFELKFEGCLLFSTAMGGSKKLSYSKNKVLSFSISQVDSSHLFLAKENIVEEVSEVPSTQNLAKDRQFAAAVKNMLQSGLKKEYGVISLIKNKEYGFIFSESHAEEIYFRLADFYYADLPLIKDGLEVEFFVISEVNKGKMSNRAMYLRLLPANSSELDLVVVQGVKLLVLSAPLASTTHSSLHSQGQGELETPLTLEQLPADLLQEEGFPASTFQPAVKTVGFSVRCLPHDKFVTKKGDEYLVDIVYYRPKQCFLAKNFRLLRFSPFDRDFGVVISSSKFNYSTPNPSYKGDKERERERESNKVVIFSLSKYLLLQSKEARIFGSDYRELSLVPSVNLNPAGAAVPEEEVESVQDPSTEFLLKVGTFVSFDTVYEDKKQVKSIRLRVCSQEEVQTEKESPSAALVSQGALKNELFSVFYAQIGERIPVADKDSAGSTQKTKKSKNALLNDLKNLIKTNKLEARPLEEDLLQFFLMKDFLLTPKLLIEKNLKGHVVKKVRTFGTPSADKEKNFLLSEKTLLNIVQRSPVVSSGASSPAPTSSASLTFSDYFGSLTPVALASQLAATLTLSSRGSEEIGQLEVQSASGKTLGNMSGYIFYNKALFNQLLTFLFSAQYSSLNSLSLTIVPSYVLRQYELVIELFFSNLLSLSVTDSFFYNGSTYKTVTITRSFAAPEEKLAFYTKENFFAFANYMKSVKAMIKKNNSQDSASTPPPAETTGKKKLPPAKKQSEHLVLPFLNSDYLTDALYGPLDNGHEVVFSAYWDPLKNKVMAKELVMTDEPISDLDSAATHLGVLEVLLNKQQASQAGQAQAKVFFNGFIRHVETDEKFYWNNYHFSSPSTLKEVKSNSLVSFQVRKRGGLRCAINISVLPTAARKALEKKEDEVSETEVLCLMVSPNHALPLDLTNVPSLESRYLSYSTFARAIGETLFLNERGDWKKGEGEDAPPTPASYPTPEVSHEFRPSYYPPLGREPVSVSFKGVSPPVLAAGDLIKARVVSNIYKSRSVLSLVFSSVCTEVKAVKKMGKILRTKATLKNLIELKGSRYSGSHPECVLPPEVYSPANLRYNFPSLELMEIQDFDEISTSDRQKILCGFPSPPYSYYFAFFSDAYILKDVANFVVDKDANLSSIHIGDSMHYYIIPELFGNLAFFPYFETFHDLQPTKLALSAITQGDSDKLTKRKEFTFVPAIYAQGPPTETAKGFPPGWMTVDVADIATRPWSHLLK